MDSDKIVLPLDVDSMDHALKLVSELKEYVGVFKIGKELFTSEGPDIVKKINFTGAKVFLDLKYHDIPNTVAKAGIAATKLGVYMFDVHCSGGKEMMHAVVESVHKTSLDLKVRKPLILGITILTSISQKSMNDELRISGDVESQVVHYALLAKECGLDGVVASPNEIKAIREACGKNFLIVTPGVRPLWAPANDQKRVMTPKEAVASGADYVVIGRPILNAANRVDAAKKILEEISV